MFRTAFLALPLVLTPVALPAPAAAAQEAQSRTGENCDQQGERRRGRGIGGALGGIAGGFIGGPIGTVTTLLPVGSLLGGAIASLLDCREQRQAAHATEQATEQATAQAERGGDVVGTTATWESETRPGVTGSSTVTAVASVNGDDCMTVTDVVIIDGNETTAPKTMCRRPPTNRYVRV